MTPTLDEFFQKYEATRTLLENLEANMDVYGEELDTKTKEGFMRVNLIMIRQCLQDFGAE